MRTLLFAAALAVSLSAQAQIEKPDVHIAVGGRTALYYLPLTLTERLGYFKDEGLNLRISDFPGGTRSLEAGERDARHAAAAQSVQSDGFVKDLVNLFDAKVVDSTIKQEGK